MSRRALLGLAILVAMTAATAGWLAPWTAPWTSQAPEPGWASPWASPWESTADPPPQPLREDATWTWFHDPRAIRVDDVTYLTWAATDGIYVGAYHHDTELLDAFRLHTPQSDPPEDDHNVAAVGIRPDGRLLVAYSDHNDTAMRVRVSTNPGDVTSWSAEQQVAIGGVTYPNLIHLSAEGRWYLFYRQNEGYGDARPPAFVISDDDGATWSGEQQLATAEVGERPYVKVASNGFDRIHFLITDKHPQRGDASVFHFWYAGGQWFDSAGADIGPLPVEHASMTLINDGTVVNSWVWDIALDGADPVIVYATFPAEDDHRYHYGWWTGSQWETSEIVAGGDTIAPGTTEPLYSGGLALNHDDPNVVYLSRQIGIPDWHIERWVTSDGGRTWDSEILVSDGKNMRPVGVRGGPETVIYFGGVYLHFTKFDTDLFHFDITPE